MALTETPSDQLMESKRVCVVGAGISGLVTCKYLLEKGFRPVVFESSRSIGGVWASPLGSTRLQTPTDYYRFTDFPWPESVTGVPNHRQVMEYLEAYARRFDLIKHVRFGEKVVGLDYVGSDLEEMAVWDLWGRSGDAFAGDGRGVWNITVEKDDGATAEHVMDFVIICLGRFSGLPNIPDFPKNRKNKGPEVFVFNGKVIHSMDLANMGSTAAMEFVNGKRIVVIGFLKSALDIAAECADINGVDLPCTMIVRTKRWNVLDFSVCGIPFSYYCCTRFSELLFHKPGEGTILSLLATMLTPLRWVISKIVESYIKKITPIEKYGMVPDHSFFEAASSILVAILPEKFYERVNNKSILLKHSKKFEFCQDGVILEGESVPIKADLVIFATGYKGDQKLRNIFKSPSIQEIVTGSSENTVPLYRECIHPRIPQMAIIGYSESYSNLYTSEIRAMWLSYFLKGGFRLPRIKLMEEDVKEWDKYMKKYSREHYRRSSIGVIHIWYNDQLCKDMGYNPRRKKWFLPELFMPYGPNDYVGLGSKME
ncbi:LOW QUALITY PROTEIN: probable flavin-containing monooxygenase 1 [Phalaenopsis equestris]|uniref:LOW QUALITY PROTEIN: probable flavin-containing monooxygenase 1 n=1 Tax=Phalaenopsis equestris TaxID=78828 RepID=UPI0009E62FC1|nr:LOW QUALITY PROTEIN: probable flavin-containing monooxygenase 1 [Phalaenopsis equestris]